MSEFKYTDYCTAFFCEDDSEVWIYDEVKDKAVQIIKVKSEDEAKGTMLKWLNGAPNNCICHIL